MTTSLKKAAEIAADCLEIPWKDVSKVYSSLLGNPDDQSDKPMLPKATGRRIWAAHPNFISRLLVGLASTDTHLSPYEACLVSFGLKQDGAAFGLTEGHAVGLRNPYESFMFEILTSRERASLLERVTLSIASGTVEFLFKGEELISFLPTEEFVYPDGSNPTHHDRMVVEALGRVKKTAMQRPLVVDGSVFRCLQLKIDWIKPGEPPHSTL